MQGAHKSDGDSEEADRCESDLSCTMTRGPPALNTGISQIVRAGFADTCSYMFGQDGRYYPALATVDNIRQQLSNAYDQPFLHRFRAWLPEVSNEVCRDTARL